MECDSSGRRDGTERIFNSSGESDFSMPKIALISTRWGGNPSSKWRAAEKARTKYSRKMGVGWVGDVLEPHASLIESFAGILSPTEAMAVLMHALSSDTLVIFVMVMALGFFKNLLQAFEFDAHAKAIIRHVDVALVSISNHAYSAVKTSIQKHGVVLLGC